MGDILYIATARGTATDVVSRVFAPGAGIDEDPVTGAAHCVITPYWAERLGKDRFTAFQASARGGYLTCRLIGERAVLGGNCVTVIEGGFTLPSPLRVRWNRSIPQIGRASCRERVCQYV